MTAGKIAQQRAARRRHHIQCMSTDAFISVRVGSIGPLAGLRRPMHCVTIRRRWMQMSRWLDRFTASITNMQHRRSSSGATRLRFTIPAVAAAAATIATSTTTTRPANARALVLILAAGLGCSVVGWWAQRHASFGKGPQEREDEQQEGDGGRAAAGTTCPAWYRPPVVTIERFATGAAQAPRAPLPWLRTTATHHTPLLHVPLETQQTSRYRPRHFFAGPSASAPGPVVTLLTPSSQHRGRVAFASTSPAPSVPPMSQSSPPVPDGSRGDDDASGSRNKRRVTKREWSGAVAGADGWQFTARAAPDLQRTFFDASHLAAHPDARGLVWMGGDVATSIQLSEDRYLWLFGDTIIGKNATTEAWVQKGGIHAFPRQSLALARMTAGSAPRPTDVSFCWKRKTPSSTEGERAGDGERAGEVTTDKVIVPGVPLELHRGKEEAKADKQLQATASKPASHNVVSFFDPTPEVIRLTPPPDMLLGPLEQHGNENKTLVLGPEDDPPPPSSEAEAHEGAWYWVLSGLRFAPETPLFLTASILSRTKANALGFEVTGTGALLVANPDDDPQAWTFAQTRVPGTRGVLNWSAGLLREGEWLYMVGVHGEGLEAKQVLARVPGEAAATRLDFAEMEVWARDPKAPSPRWIPNTAFMAVEPYYTLEPLLPWGQLGVSELSVAYDEDLKRYLMVTLPAFSNKVQLWAAKVITGPWSASTVLDVEEFEAAFQQQPAYRTGQKQRLFYSAKLHPELATTHAKPRSPDNPSTSSSLAGAGGASDLFFASLSPAHRKTTGSKRAAEKELVVSYCANVLGDWPAPADYTPRFLRVVLRRSEDADREGSSEVAAAGRQGDL